MGAYQDTIQRAVVGITAMVRTLLNSAFNRFVCMAVHSHFLLFRDGLSMAQKTKSIQKAVPEMISGTAFLILLLFPICNQYCLQQSVR